MKKLLLSTSALAGASVLAAGTAMAAEKPSASLRGFYDFAFAYADEDADTATNEYSDTVFYVEYEFSVRAKGKADNGLEYGAKFEVAPDANTTRDEAGFYVKHSNFGTVQLGQDDGVSSTMSVYYKAAWGMNGADGDFDEIVQGGTATDNGAIKLVGGDMSLGDSTKISYYSPRFSGFDFGLSYQLTANETDDARSHRQIKNGGNAADESMIQMALRYTGKFDDVGVKAGLTYASITTQETRAASVNTQAFEDPSGYQAGISLSMAGWTLGGGYVSWSDVLNAHSNPTAAASGVSVDDATSINFGVHYKTGAWTIGANYLMEEADGVAGDGVTNENENMGLGFRYQLAPGLRLVGELVFFDHSDGGTATTSTNDGDRKSVV